MPTHFLKAVLFLWEWVIQGQQHLHCSRLCWAWGLGTHTGPSTGHQTCAWPWVIAVTPRHEVPPELQGPCGWRALRLLSQEDWEVRAPCSGSSYVSNLVTYTPSCPLGIQDHPDHFLGQGPCQEEHGRCQEVGSEEALPWDPHTAE